MAIEHEDTGFEGLLRSFRNLHVLIIGDLVLDRYWWGEASRLSPEAPVPVFLKQRETIRPGGAANSAMNVAALGAKVHLVGIVGDDPEGTALESALAAENIKTHFIRTSKRTTTKTRVISGSQHLVRIDEEEPAPIEPCVETELLGALLPILSKFDGIIISDYAKGLLTPHLLSKLMESARAHEVPTFVDPKVADCLRYHGASILKPNRKELEHLTKRSLCNVESTINAGVDLQRQLGGQTDILVTQGSDGMGFISSSGEIWYEPARAREVFDITGAGDTVLATFALARLAGALVPNALRLASTAASVTVSRVGACSVAPAELTSALRSFELSNLSRLSPRPL